MDKVLLKKIGEALYGHRWQTDLADEMGVSSRQVRSWMSGATIPDKRTDQLKKIINNRQQALQYLLQEFSD